MDRAGMLFLPSCFWAILLDINANPKANWQLGSWQGEQSLREAILSRPEADSSFHGKEPGACAKAAALTMNSFSPNPPGSFPRKELPPQRVRMTSRSGVFCAARNHLEKEW